MVQGVCFRFVSRDFANRYRITGWVRNLSDGRVELLAEGKKEDVNDFLSDIKREFRTNITDCQMEEREPEGYEDFQIRF